MSDSKVIIATNQAGFEAKLKNIKKNIEALNEGRALCSDITEKAVLDFDFEAVTDWLKNYSPQFSNVKAVADLLGKKDLYLQLEQIHTQKEQLLSDYIVQKPNKEYVFDTGKLSYLRDEFTTFLNPDKIATYKKLKKVIDILNEIDVVDVNSLQRTYEGKYTINLYKLNQSNLVW